MDENSTKRSSCRSPRSASRCAAPAVLAPTTSANSPIPVSSRGVELADACRVDDTAQRLVLRHGCQEVFHRGPVGHVTGGHGDFNPQGGQLLPQSVGVRRVRTTSAHQQQVLRARTCQPACNMAAQRAGSTGDQDRAARGSPRGDALCRVGSVGAVRVADHAAGGSPRRPDCQLVLPSSVVKHGKKPGKRWLVQNLGEIDKPSPTSGSSNAAARPGPELSLFDVPRLLGTTDETAPRVAHPRGADIPDSDKDRMRAIVVERPCGSTGSALLGSARARKDRTPESPVTSRTASLTAFGTEGSDSATCTTFAPPSRSPRTTDST